jgi:hypothetical protein
MEKSSSDHENDLHLKCPECRHPLKRRRSRNPDECELVCGGCGRRFDICDLETLDRLKRNSR